MKKLPGRLFFEDDDSAHGKLFKVQLWVEELLDYLTPEEDWTKRCICKQFATDGVCEHITQSASLATGNTWEEEFATEFIPRLRDTEIADWGRPLPGVTANYTTMANFISKIESRARQEGFDAGMKAGIESEVMKKPKYVQEGRDESLDTSKVTRVEVIDHTPEKQGDFNYRGRVYVKWDEKIKVELSFQDEGKTLKVLINSLE